MPGTLDWPTEFFSAALVLCKRNFQAIQARRAEVHVGGEHPSIWELHKQPLRSLGRSPRFLLSCRDKQQVFKRAPGLLPMWLFLTWRFCHTHCQESQCQDTAIHRQHNWKDKATGRYSRRVKPEQSHLLVSQKHNSGIKVCSYFLFSYFHTFHSEKLSPGENSLYSPCKQINKIPLKC